MDPAEGLIDHPYAVYDRLRDTAPVHRVAGTDGNPAWLVTRYEDVREALANPLLSMDKKHALPGSYQGLSLPPALDANLLNMEAPDHTRIRRLVVRAFTARRIEQLRTPVRETADRLLDALGRHGSADLMTAYAAPLPITVICDLLGIPGEHRRDFRAWTDVLVAPDPTRPGAAKEAVAAMLGFLTQLLADKRKKPADDLLSDLIAVRDEGDRLSEDELMSLAFLILFAGYENTVQLIGNAILGLLTHPDQLAALRANPERFPNAVEEFARHEGPALLAIRRFPVEDVTIGAVTVPAGETVLLSLAAANRDPARFPDPERLDLGRDASGHLALGRGIHYCVGAPLARLETEIAVSALLERLPDLALDTDPVELRWRPSLRARGLLALPVTY
ncbi:MULTISPECIES: cytochrome P450 [unclassified Streptomyces]|uniref:cytochrome P450 family protein n=1 Tax=unclassified Streptomyces TaxID=2593676 RepID=UPI001162F102|nr:MULTISPECIES: cytochrome P450 [unclassified Streptomyces]NMI57569.1 cytochrome P450 [Streptomyces sp. RLA2-12]QDN56922.1 cytochrome P450 [Streptomyces sp. S1D4-20]QDN67099.1 cytochrome P450 [Streptomyces sp. S1D4-14]QDO49505.1 cytochrome P450 [Streptomyces sp. RLB3-5]QDO59747.1 cytochrome P450 [Streptomyces sp. RLB1-8]